ncbi:TonB-dependent receptor [Sphingomonas baiyangensis]|uniref:TonB-dependent receptor n=1 Tax=Sphingomonas baiyangensis TaxID=2572576 RepID=A0A4U1L3M5_9SPHN|nr:TonB-dependent receptor [Sphingomonas baiyangensis]TKD51084.1 TonB-dependent receptor [Sphingomonas baiyangensis]
MNRSPRWLALPLTIAAAPAAAQTLAPAAPPEIVVTGRGLDDPPPRSDAVATIARARLTATASDRLEDVLGDIAGLQSFRRADSRSANPTSQGITLRGIGGNASSRALLVLDGVPQADPFGGWIAFPALAPGALGEVRVQRGGGGARWGSGALAGVVELVSATPDQLSPATLDIAGGARGSIDAQASASLVGETGFATIRVGHARGDGFVPIVADDRGAVDRAAPFAQTSIGMRAVTRIAPETELQGNVAVFRDRRDRGLAFTGIESDGADASVRLVGRGAWRWSALGYVQTRRFASGFASVNADRTSVSPALDQYNVPGTGIGGRIEVAPPLGEAITLLIGADTRRTSGTTNERYSFTDGEPTRLRRAGGVTATYGAFADLQLTAGLLRLDLNGRIDGWRITDGRITERPIGGGAAFTDARFADRAGSEWTGRAGLALAASDSLTLRTAAYRGWRLPNPNELYRPFRVGADATAANALVAPETLMGVEAGATLAPSPATSLGVTLFANRLDDAVTNVTIARGPGNFPGVGFVSAAGVYRRRENLDAIVSRGVEVDGRVTLGAVVASLSYALSDARVRDSRFGLDGLRPAQVPMHQASATIGWARARTAASLTLRYQAEVFEDDENRRTLSDALTLDGAAALPLGKGVAVEARIENAFDARVETGFSGSAIERARPRTWWLGLNARLD